MSKADLTPLGCISLGLVIAGIAFLWCYFIAWITVLVLKAFGVEIGIWTAFGVWFLISAIASLFRPQSK